MHNGHGASGHVIGLELVPSSDMVIKRVVVLARPARLGRGVNLQGQVAEKFALAVVQAEVALVDEDQEGIIIVERRCRGVFVFNPR